MTVTAEPLPLGVGDDWSSEPCGSCGHSAEGKVIGFYDGERTPENAKVSFQGAPPADCACECHTGWRLINRVPVQTVPPSTSESH